ncbi:MAG: patatin-like phospholipase family protein, partial [Deltaproteobacteria bacterium]|nr:patatin-like phospholipase family protein [Deltaproteobacteria bacterium]
MFTTLKHQLRPKARFFILVLLTALIFLSQGCIALQVRHPLPEHLMDQVQVADLPGVRAWGDTLSASLEQNAIESIRQEMAANHGKLLPEANFLALSGGGGDGAFGAGILCGWTAAGTRPQFKLVTGISTGALIAPFAFLGPEYDARLKEAYTTISDQDIYTVPNLLKLVINLGRIEGAASTEPLARLLERIIDDNMIQAIAVEHNKGRRLLVGTTQLDAQRQVIWNMGAIAASGHPDAPKLFRQVLRASASIPVAFSPVYIKVKAGGQEYDEMHVDGGVRAEVMLYEEALNIFVARKKLGLQIPHRPRKLYIIRNAQVYPEYESIKPNISKIGTRAIGSLTKYQGVGDLYRI